MDWMLAASLGAAVLALCALAQRRFENVAPPFAFSTMLVTYGLAVFQALHWFRWMALGAAACLWALAVLRMIRKGLRASLSRLAGNVFTPGLVCFVGLAVLFHALSQEHIVTATDDIYYWSIEARSIFAHNGLVASAQHLSPRFMTYTPGMQLWQWLGLAVTGEWSEPVLYSMLWLFYALCCLPLMHRVTWRNAYWMPVFVTALIAAPTVFNPDAYAMLRVDTALGFCMGYTLIQVWRMAREDEPMGWGLLCLAVGLGVLALVKQVGIGWALIPISLLWLAVRPIKERAFGMALACLAPLAVFVSWKVVCAVFQLSGAHLNLASAQISAILAGTWDAGDRIQQMAQAIGKLFVLTPAAWNSTMETWLTLPRLLWGAILVLIPTLLSARGKARRLALWASGSFVAAMAAMAAILLTALYNEPMPAEGNDSFQYALMGRYFCPWMVGMLVLCVCALSSPRGESRPWLRRTLAAGLCALVVLCAEWPALKRDLVPSAYAETHNYGQFDTYLAENFWVDELEEPQDAIVLYGVEVYPFKAEWIQYIAAPAKLVFPTDSEMDDAAFRSWLTGARITHVVFMDDANPVYQNALSYTEDGWLDVCTVYTVSWEDGEPVIGY